jgi:hypothetical protein
MLTISNRIPETARKAETADQRIPTAVVDTHDLSSKAILLVVPVLNNLQHPGQAEKILMPRTEATTTMWQCGMQPWLNNNSSNRVQVSRPDRQVLDDDKRGLTCDVVTVTLVSSGAVTA